MAINTKLLNNSYVKFVRTTVDKWNLLIQSGAPDADTLYFVIEAGGVEGSLYLGSVLIATSVDAGLNLNQLNDVVLEATKTDDVLVYTGSRWVNKPISSFMPVTMVGATAEEDGEGGLVPVPLAGENDLYLKGDGTWADPTVAVVEDLSKLSTKVDGLDSNLTKVIGGDLGKSMRAVAGEVAAEKVAAIVDNAPQAFDTLKEIAEWIQGSDKYASDALDLATDIQALEDAVFGTDTEDGLVDKTEALEQSVGTLQTNLQNLTEGFNNLHAVVGDSSTGLVKKVNDINTTVNNHTTQISELAEKLMWNELVEE